MSEFQKINFGLSEFFCKPVYYRPESSRTRISKNMLYITCKSIAPDFGDFFFHSNLVCSLSKNESNRKKKKMIITKFHFFMRVLRNRISKKFRYIYALNHLPFKRLSRLLTSFETFLGLRTSVKLKG